MKNLPNLSEGYFYKYIGITTDKSMPNQIENNETLFRLELIYFIQFLTRTTPCTYRSRRTLATSLCVCSRRVVFNSFQRLYCSPTYTLDRFIKALVSFFFLFRPESVNVGFLPRLDLGLASAIIIRNGRSRVKQKVIRICKWPIEFLSRKHKFSEHYSKLI